LIDNVIFLDLKLKNLTWVQVWTWY